MSFGDDFVDLGAHFGGSPHGVACSSGGMVVFVADYSAKMVFKSIDGGVSFDSGYSFPDSGLLWSVAVSDDGQIVYVLDRHTTKPFFKSIDGGVSYSEETNVFGGKASGISCSSDGAVVLVCDGYSQLVYRSEDYGVTFVSGVAQYKELTDVACSSDTSIIYSCIHEFAANKSVNSGLDYASITPFAGNTHNIACSSDGSILYSLNIENERLYASFDGGISHEDKGANFGSDVRGVTCSNDGSVVYVLDSGTDSIYRSGTPSTEPVEPPVEPQPPTERLIPESKANIATGDLISAENEVQIDTGNLLNSEAVSVINTGDLLNSEAIGEIVTGSIIPATPLPDSSDFPLNHARIGYQNTLTGVYSSVNGVNHANLLTPSTYDKYRVTGNGSVTLESTALSMCDYVGIAAHNLGSQGANLTVKVSAVAGSGEVTIYNQVPSNNNALFIRFTEQNCKYLTIELSSSSDLEIGVVFLGAELEMMRPIFSGHKPSVLNSNDTTTPQMSDGGQFLGKQIVRQGFTTSADFQHLSDEWYRDKFQPFVEHAKTRPYFWAWNLLESPEDVVYAWTNGNISPSYMGIRNWLQVSFDIEAHA